MSENFLHDANAPLIFEQMSGKTMSRSAAIFVLFNRLCLHQVVMNRKLFKPIIITTLIASVLAIAFLFIHHSISSRLTSTSSPVFNVSEEVEEYAIYSALLKKLFIKDKVQLLKIQKQTSFLDLYFFIPVLII